MDIWQSLKITMNLWAFILLELPGFEAYSKITRNDHRIRSSKTSAGIREIHNEIKGYMFMNGVLYLSLPFVVFSQRNYVFK